LLFFAGPRTTEGDWVVPVELEPNLVWIGAREVKDWHAGTTIEFDPTVIGFPGSFRGAGKRDWVWNVVLVKDGLVVARSEARREVRVDPAEEKVWDVQLKPMELEGTAVLRWLYPRGPREQAFLGKGLGAWSFLWLFQKDSSFRTDMTVEAPAPLDFSEFYGVDLTKRPGQIFLDAQGKRLPHPTIPEFSIAEWALQDSVLDPHHGFWGSMEHQFGPPTPEGYERPMFNRGTGETDPVVLEHWLKFDLARLFVEKKIDASGITILKPDASALSFCKKTGARCVVD